MKFSTFIALLASAAAVKVDSLDEPDNSNSDAVAEATGFDGFGGFGGFRGFHQFNGLMSNAFGDLDGQFDTTGFNKDFSAPQNRKFDTGYGQHFLEDLDHDSFRSDLGSPSNQQNQGRPSPIIQNVAKKYTYGAVPLPTSKYTLGQPTAGKNSYVNSKHKKVPSQYKALPYQGLYAENLPKNKVAEIILPAYSVQGAATPNFGTKKFTAKLIQKTPPVRQDSDRLKHFAEQYNPEEGFDFGAEKLY